MDLTDLASFIRVAEAGTITAAAEAEGVTKSTISRRIARLEEALGVELLRRSARAFTLTADGEALHARASGAVRELESLSRTFTDIAGEPSGTLVVTMPHDMGRVAATVELFCRYRETYPKVALDLRFSNRMVDLISEGVDIALRAHNSEMPGSNELMMRRLSVASVRLFASESYMERNGPITTPEQLSEHPIIAHPSLRARPLVRVSAEGEEEDAFVLLDAAVMANDFSMIEAFTRAGQGIGIMVQPNSISSGLVRVLPQWAGRASELSIVWPRSRQLAPRVRAFVDMATENLSPLASEFG